MAKPSPQQRLKMLLQNKSFFPDPNSIHHKESTPCKSRETVILKPDVTTMFSERAQIETDLLITKADVDVPPTAETKASDITSKTAIPSDAEPKKPLLPEAIPTNLESRFDAAAENPSKPKSSSTSLASELEGLFNITTNIEDSVVDYAEKNDTRVASLENKISALITTVDSLVETCKSLKMKTADVQQKNDKIKQQKEKIAALKEQNEEYRTITEQKIVEITLLNQRLQHKEEMYQCRLELFQKIQDVETQLKVNIQEKQELNSITAEELRVKLLNLEEAVSKKAAQSSLDKLAEKSAISHVSPPPEPLNKPIIAENIKDDLENPEMKAPPKTKSFRKR